MREVRVGEGTAIRVVRPGTVVLRDWRPEEETLRSGAFLLEVTSGMSDRILEVEVEWCRRGKRCLLFRSCVSSDSTT